MEIHHYTRASTLPLILQTGKLRFTRADHLDDLTELPFETFHLSRQTYFLNSWVRSDIEKSGQWYRYADQHRGIRLSTKTPPFPMNSLKLKVSRPYKTKNGDHKTVGLELNEAPTHFTKETMFGNGFILMPWANHEHFGGDVLYVENPNTYVKQFISSSTDATEIIGGSRLTRIKAKHWEDQSEYRFTLMAVQGPKLIYTENPNLYENELLNLLEHWQSLGTAAPAPEVPFIDLPVSPLFFENMTVTLGSSISDTDRSSVLQSIQLYAPNTKILESSIRAR